MSENCISLLLTKNRRPKKELAQQLAEWMVVQLKKHDPACRCQAPDYVLSEREKVVCFSLFSPSSVPLEGYIYMMTCACFSEVASEEKSVLNEATEIVGAHL